MSGLAVNLVIKRPHKRAMAIGARFFFSWDHTLLALQLNDSQSVGESRLLRCCCTSNKAINRKKPRSRHCGRRSLAR